MLVLSRKRDEVIVIGDDGNPAALILVKVIEIRGESVRLGVSAGFDVPVDRAEIRDRKRAE